MAFVLSEFIVQPFGEFPLNDDWAYTKALNNLRLYGKIDIGTWPAMTLLTHVLWGYGFTGVFGFSFFVLRLSTLVSSFAGLVTLYRIIQEISGNSKLSLGGTLILLFNPLYFNLSNTFMTDVNFNTLLLLGIYACFRFFKTKNSAFMIVIAIISVLLVLLRQYGIILPFCFFISSLFFKDKRAPAIAYSVAVLLMAFFVLRYYESHLREVLPAEASYRFSEKTDFTRRAFWDLFFENLTARVVPVIYILLFYLSPLALLFLKSVSSGLKALWALVVLTICFFTCYFLFRANSVQISNVFMGLSLGTETFVNELRGGTIENIHNNPDEFKMLFPWISLLLASISLSFIVICSINIRALKTKAGLFKEKLFICSLIVSYLFFIILTDSYFDRYHVPFISFGIIFTVLFCGPAFKTKSQTLFVVILIPFVYVSVLGTKDYFERSRKTWEAYEELYKTEMIDRKKINPGFEAYFWNSGKKDPALWDFFDENKFDYIIGYEAPEGFKPYKSYSFQRYCPYIADSVVVYARDSRN